MTDQDLDLSGFQAERRVDVPPPRKKKPAAAPTKPAGKKAKKGKKKKKSSESAPKDTPPIATPPEPTVSPPESTPVVRPVAGPKPVLSPMALGSSKTGRKKRVNVSIPVELSRRFTEKAAREDRYLTDMLLDAYRDHYAELRDRYIAEQGDTDLPFRPRRRKAASGRVTHMLYLAVPEIAVIDGSAVEIGLSRSELVSQLLDRELG